MKLLGVVLQKKNGENIIIASTPSLPTRNCVMYSHLIYEHIQETFRNRLKIQRTITLQQDLYCVCNIKIQYILYVFISKYDLPLAFQAIRKIGDYFTRPGSSSASRVEQIPKKIVEYMSTFQQFLYTRELSLKQFIPLNQQTSSNKKSVDFEIFNKFAHINNQNDKRTIYDTQILSSRVEGNQVKKKMMAIQNAQKFYIKSQDEIYLLDIDPEKQKYINSYKKNIFKLGMGKKKKTNQFRKASTIISFSNSVSDNLDITTTQLIEETTIIQKQKIKLKIKQKLSLTLQNDKIKQVSQIGQIVVEGNQKQKATLILTPESLWSNSKIISKRITPNSLQCKQKTELTYQFETTNGYKSKPIIDYVMKTQTFNQDKIPLLFIYTMQVSSSNVEFTFKYKMNQNWKYKIHQFDINIFLNKQFVVLDCKSIPVANSLKNNKVTWKTKQISPNSQNSKGKILLAFSQVKFSPKKILSQIRLNMKSNCGLIQNLNADLKQQFNICSSGQKTLIIEYRITPE